MIFTHDTTRLLLLAGLSLSYAGVCLAPWLRARARRRAAVAARAALAGNPAWLVAYASQTGNAEELATQTAHSLQLAGVAVRVCALAELTAQDLQQAERALFLVSTYGEGDAPDWSAPAFDDWRLTERCLLNPGSAGGPIYHMELAPASGVLPDWQSGDLVQLAAPADPSKPREYSIASIPQDGRVHLLVRQHSHPDGSLGVASGWLTQAAQPGDLVQLRVRQHRRFRLEDNAGRPLILIGNGSGIAGLRGHLKSRILAGQRRNWLLFGERNAAHDAHYHEELQRWHASGDLPRLDLVFSRDQEQRLYVQDRLRGNADEVLQWLAQGAAIYVCGSLAGMAGGVDQALEEMLGRTALDALAAQGRYRRDVY